MRCLLLTCLCCLLTAGEDGGRDWPCWRGPLGNGATAPSGAELIDAADRARKLWSSEQHLSTSWLSPNRFGVGRDAGYSSPVLVDGKVYLTWFEVSGDRIERSQFERANRKGRNEGREADFAIDADDLLVCIDARNGKTLWRRRWEKNAFNPRVLGGLHYATPCVAAGKVFTPGIMGMVYAVDAGTGESAWEVELPRRAALVQALEEFWAAEDRFQRAWFKGKNSVMGERNNGRNAYVCPPAYAAGVVAVTDMVGGLVGLDAATGEARWRVPGCLGHRGELALTWSHGGETWFIAGNRNGVTAIAAGTGTVAWRIEDGNLGAGFGLCVSGDLLIGKGRKGNSRRPGGGPACYRLSETGGELLWRLEERYTAGNGNTSGITVWGEHAYWLTSRDNSQGGRPPGYLYCAELATGAIVAKCEAPTAMFSCLAAGDGVLAFSQHRKGLLLYRADPTDLRLLGTLDTPSTYCITPLVCRGLVVNRTGTGLDCFDLRVR